MEVCSTNNLYAGSAGSHQTAAHGVKRAKAPPGDKGFYLVFAHAGASRGLATTRQVPARLAAVSEIHPATVAGLAPASSASRYWQACGHIRRFACRILAVVRSDLARFLGRDRVADRLAETVRGELAGQPAIHRAEDQVLPQAHVQWVFDRSVGVRDGWLCSAVRSISLPGRTRCELLLNRTHEIAPYSN